MITSFEDRLTELRNKWFLMEPAYFMVLCTHKIEVNSAMKCDIACGGGRIYLNDTMFEDKSDKFLEEKMKAEILRILLKHPYQRQLPNRVKMYIASNLTIGNNTSFSEAVFKNTRDFFGSWQYDKASFEEIYDAIKAPSEENSGSKGKGNKGNASGNGQGNDPFENFDDGCNSTDDAIEKTQYWKEDDFYTVEINNVINKIDKTNSWGKIPGNLADIIKKSIEPKFNYKAIFQQFRSTIISSARTITRMKPNRRFGYAMPGSKRDFTTKILVAVDTSGSMSNDDLQLSLGFIKNFFKYGISRIDVIQFDTKIYPESLVELHKAPKEFKITGRGGTDFNEVFQYTQEKDRTYDGVIIFTDGYASVPQTKWLSNNYRKTKYIWCLNDEHNFEHFRKNERMLKFGKATYVDKRDKK
jgi:predicted metal-dependent peptidase